MIEIYNLEPPKLLTESLARIGGLNPFGDPNFRVIWGWKRLAWHGGKFHDRDDSGNSTRIAVEKRLEPRYLPANRWYFELWMPPEAYGTPEKWYEQTVEWIDGQRVETLGPYPNRGDYECGAVLQTPLVGECKKRGICHCGGALGCHGYAPLDSGTIEMLCYMAIATRNMPQRLRKLARDARKEEKRKERTEQAIDKILERGPAFEGKPFVDVPKRRNDVQA